MPLGVTDRTLRKAKAELVEAELLKVDVREGAGGRQTSNLYTLFYAGEGVHADRGEGVHTDRDEGVHTDRPRSKKKKDSTKKREDVDSAFTKWIEVTGRTGRTQLDDTRRRAIEKALVNYPPEEVLEAIDGWQFSDFHRGKNDQGKVYDEITLILRNAGQIEKFRDLSRAAKNGHRSGQQPRSWDTLQQMAKEATLVDSPRLTP